MQTCIANLHPSQLTVFPNCSTDLSRWYMDVDASCWFRSLAQNENTIRLLVEYDDAVRPHSNQIDCARSSYFKECLLSGRHQISGYGPVASVRFILESAGPIDMLDATFKLSNPHRAHLKIAA